MMGAGATNCDKNTPVLHPGSFYLFIIQESVNHGQTRAADKGACEDVYGEGEGQAGRAERAVLQPAGTPHPQGTTGTGHTVASVPCSEGITAVSLC